MKRHTTKILFALVILIWGAIVAVLFWPRLTGRTSDEPVFCTLEAKLCSDGSSVGRTPPRCEFAPCPSGNSMSDMDSWKTAVNDEMKVEFKHPEKLSTTYVQSQAWPPTVKTAKGSFSCPEHQGDTNGLPTQVAPRVIDGKTYCVESQSEGAAGSTYVDYVYATAKADELASLSFTLRYPECQNYDDPKKTECQHERETFNLDRLVDEMFDTLRAR